ncbi:DUF58 domain-containing protein [Engelhardtia mirabilis]|uniref:DUF58 domain-containing protein n=1 Tax=Engelhardtia mirabilis TaxID=2528011 RepID=A0A518BNN2_9BACT|nr:hypothetical protein Pla133_36910 [Planctomycetes bacterium Pla133]QDV02917.1 hypothetical protein Pla86_36890 [Planctomycetes bacterium Pla86]
MKGLRPRSIPLPTARAFGLLCASALVALASTPIAGVAVVFVLALVAVDGWLASRERGLTTTFDLPRRVGQGQQGQFHLELDNRSGREQRLVLAVEADPSLVTAQALAPREVTVPQGGRARLAFDLHARLRGTRGLAALHLRRRGPLGLAWRLERRAQQLAVEIIPGLREANAHVMRTAYHQRRDPGLRRARRRGNGGSFESLRGYVRGDDPRHLDWKATARHGAAMVRQYEAERSQSIVLCIDCGRMMGERFGELERLDHALAASVVLARVAATWHDQVGLFAFADRVLRRIPPRAASPDRLASELASLKAISVEPDYPRALLELTRTLRRRSLIVCFTDVVDDEVSAPLAAHLALLARRHLPLLIALRNPHLALAAAAPVTDERGAYRRAAAAELESVRAVSLAGLRRAGVQVVDIDPNQSVPAVIEAYLRIKSRQIL